MLPADTPQQDWTLYFNNTFMMHSTKGIVYVQIHQDEDYVFAVRRLDDNGMMSDNNYQTVDKNDLRIWWPRPGAYNSQKFKCAVVVGRKPMRHMKRSASHDHYYCVWAGVPLPVNPLDICAGKNKFFSVDEFRKSGWDSGALSPHIVLHNSAPGRTEVIYMGDIVGSLNNKNQFEPYYEFDSRTDRIKQKLSAAGVNIGGL